MRSRLDNTNLKSDLKRFGCTKIHYRVRGDKEYIRTVGGEPNDVWAILSRITRFKDIRMTSGRWSTKDFTWRVI